MEKPYACYYAEVKVISRGRQAVYVGRSRRASGWKSLLRALTVASDLDDCTTTFEAVEVDGSQFTKS